MSCLCSRSEQEDAETILQRFHLLPDRAGRDVQLARGELEAQMPRRGLECAQRVQWRQQIGHGWAIMPASHGKVAADFL